MVNCFREGIGLAEKDTRRVRIGTRGSRLAMVQAHAIRELLARRFPDLVFDVDPIATEGDRVQDRPISDVGDKGIFVRSIERHLLEGDIDVAVHSLKDLPSDIVTPGLEVAAFSRREDPHDVLVAHEGLKLRELPAGSRVGTGSLRRRAQLGSLRPDLITVDIRGNVDTRLRKLDSGEYDAIILAAAGLRRLGLDQRVTEYLPVDDFLPDAGQGIMAVQTRQGDAASRLAAAIDDEEGRIAAKAERAVVRALGADCTSPVGAYATIGGSRLRVQGMAADPQTGTIYRGEDTGLVTEAETVGYRLGGWLLEQLEG
jgi:hydroxymethylbilane synthase